MKTDNELIAEFMGLTQHPTNPKRYYYKGSPTTENYGVDELHYDFSWDWLMPVVEKVIKLNPPFSDASISTPFDILYKDAVEFIKRYNLETKEEQQ